MRSGVMCGECWLETGDPACRCDEVQVDGEAAGAPTVSHAGRADQQERGTEDCQADLAGCGSGVRGSA